MPEEAPEEAPEQAAIAPEVAPSAPEPVARQHDAPVPPTGVPDAPPKRDAVQVAAPAIPYAALVNEIEAAATRVGVSGIGIDVLPDATGPDGRVLLSGPDPGVLREVCSTLLANAVGREWTFISTGLHETNGTCLLLRVTPLT